MDKIQIIMDCCDTYIEEHWQEKIDRSSLANYVGYSENHLSHIFPAYHGGRSIPSYIRQKRMEHAISGIIKGISPTQLAKDSGYSSYHSFIRAFKDEFGMTVTAYHDYILKQQASGLSPATPTFRQFPDRTYIGWRFQSERALKPEDDFAAWRRFSDRFVPRLPEGFTTMPAISLWLKLEDMGVSDYFFGYKCEESTPCGTSGTCEGSAPFETSGTREGSVPRERSEFCGELLPCADSLPDGLVSLVMPAANVAVFNVTDKAPDLSTSDRADAGTAFETNTHLGFLLRAMWIYIFKDWFKHDGAAYRLAEGRTAYEYYDGTTVRVAVPLEPVSGN